MVDIYRESSCGKRRLTCEFYTIGKFYPPVRGGMERVLQAPGGGERGRVRHARSRGELRSAHVEEMYRGVAVTRVARYGAVGTVALSPGFPRRLARSRVDVVVVHEPNPLALLSYWLHDRRDGSWSGSTAR